MNVRDFFTQPHPLTGWKNATIDIQMLGLKGANVSKLKFRHPVLGVQVMVSVEEEDSPVVEAWLCEGLKGVDPVPLKTPFFYLSVSRLNESWPEDSLVQWVQELFVPGAQFTEFTHVFTDEARKDINNRVRKRMEGQPGRAIRPKVRHFGFEIQR